MVTGRMVFYFGVGVAIVAVSLATMRVDPLYLIGGIIGILGLLAVFKYPFFGFFLYATLYFLRPGERFPGLAPLRLELVFGVLLLAAIAISDALRGARLRFPQDRVSVAFYAFLGALVVCTFFSEWKSQSATVVFAFIKLFIFYYYLAVLVNTEKRFQYAYWFIVVFTTIVGIEAAFNYFTGNFRFNQGVMRTGGATSYGDHANSLAMYMATTIPMLIYLLARYRHRIVRFLCMAMIGICFLTLLITASRGGVLCILAILVCYAWFSRHRLAYIAALVLFSVVTWIALPEQYKNRYGSIASSQIDDSSQGRLDAWKAGLGMFEEKPFVGVGPGVFAAAYLDRHGLWLYSHSLYIEALAETGILGTATFATLLVLMVLQLGRMSRVRGAPETRREELQVFARSGYAIVAGLLVAGVFGHILQRDTWYLLAGLIVARFNLVEAESLEV
jgi:probable O-glycosylation ligase (exosortase A-associated)